MKRVNVACCVLYDVLVCCVTVAQPAPPLPHLLVVDETLVHCELYRSCCMRSVGMWHRRSRTFSSSMKRLRWRLIELCPYKYLPGRANPTLSHTRSAMPSRDGPIATRSVWHGHGCDGEGPNAAHRNGIACALEDRRHADHHADHHKRIVLRHADLVRVPARAPIERRTERHGPPTLSMQDSEARWRAVAYRPTYLSHVGTPYVNMRVYMSRFSASLSTS